MPRTSRLRLCTGSVSTCIRAKRMLLNSRMAGRLWVKAPETCNSQPRHRTSSKRRHDRQREQHDHRIADAHAHRLVGLEEDRPVGPAVQGPRAGRRRRPGARPNSTSPAQKHPPAESAARR